MNSQLQACIDQVEKDYAVDKKLLCDAFDAFIKLMDEGLTSKEQKRECMPMIPTFVSRIPTGKENGLYLAGDLGGTNFRVCSVRLNGDHTFSLTQSKSRIPSELMKGNQGLELFRYLAKKVGAFLKEHHADYSCATDGRLKLGFTFSFPVNQQALDKGTLIRWTKGFDLPNVVGKDIVELFQLQLDELDAPVDVVALANDTVGTLLLRAYSNDISKSNAHTVIGCIFGTGTNGAYFELADKIKKIDVPGNGMVINTEWGSFDNTLQVLPSNRFDTIVDSETANKGYHRFEKRISGMFLGELLRVTLKCLADDGQLFAKLKEKRGGSLPHRLEEPWQLDSQVLLYLEIDDSTELRMSGLILENELRLTTTFEERLAIRAITRAISKRAGLLSSIPIAAIVSRVKDRYKDDDRDFEVGCDGLVVEFYPGFQDRVYEGLGMIDALKGLNKKVYLRIAKDGSGVGAALCASTVDN